MARSHRFVLGPGLLIAVLCLGCGRAGVTAKQAAASRAACQFTAGTMPAKSLAADDPTGTGIPVDHIVLVMQENRSFDAYFSHLTVPGQTVDAAADDVTNPDQNGEPVSRFHWNAATASNGHPDGKDYYCFSDTDHGWDQAHSEYNGGLLDGFVTTNNDDGNGRRSMGYYDETDVPLYYALARTFAISDRHFCSLLGPTWPNRMFYFAATSYGLTDNIFPPESDGDGNPYANLFTELSAAGVDWKVYAEDLPSPAIFPSVLGGDLNRIVPMTSFFTDAKSGNLPAVSVVEGSDTGKGDSLDEHPPQDMQVGEAFVASLVSALTHSPQWPRSALFLTYDENGGEYDHVAPPPACKPDDLDPKLGAPGSTTVAAFDRYGFRTPLMVVSPYARRGYVSHVVVDHTSIARFVETRFELPAMTARDANAWPLLDMFDFAHPNTTVPTLPEATIEPVQRAQCLVDYGPSSGGF